MWLHVKHFSQECLALYNICVYYISIIIILYHQVSQFNTVDKTANGTEFLVFAQGSMVAWTEQRRGNENGVLVPVLPYLIYATLGKASNLAEFPPKTANSSFTLPKSQSSFDD